MQTGDRDFGMERGGPWTNMSMQLSCYNQIYVLNIK